MQITVQNFGGYRDYSATLETLTAPNGAGKTGLLNAYYWTLTGRTLNGFEARNHPAHDTDTTQTILQGFGDMPMIRRTLASTGGTTLYVGNDVCTQTDFVEVRRQKGIDVNFASLCADANALTDSALTSEDLRTLLTRTDVIDNGEAMALRKEAGDVRKKRKTAEQFALSNVIVPPRTVQALSVSERAYVDEYQQACGTVAKGYHDSCPTCGQDLAPVQVAEQKVAFSEAVNVEQSHREEAQRLTERDELYGSETRNINDAQRLIDNATVARADVRAYEDRLKAIDDELRELDANAVRAELPERVELITEQTSKTGVTKSVCLLTYGGVPLKSVNRARRIEICVDILANAREAKGMTHVAPIIIDNAEALDGHSHVRNYANVIFLNVGTSDKG